MAKQKNNPQKDFELNINNPQTSSSKERQKGVDRLLGLFNLARTNNKKIVPAEEIKDKQGKGNGKYKPIDLPNSMQQVYEYFIGNSDTGIYQSNEFRFERYKECKYMVTVESIINTATQIYLSECYTLEEGKKPIVITAKDKKIEQEFYKWLNNAGFTDNFVREILYNIIVYGDGFWANDVDFEGKEGVREVTALDPFLIKDRLEFNIGVVNKQNQWTNNTINLSNKYKSLQQIMTTIDKQANDEDSLEDISQFYKSYLFGFELKLSSLNEGETRGVPSWGITHCRLFSVEEDFAPFGKPLFLNALASFKSYRTTQMLIDMLRASSFPREVINIKGGENMNVFSRMQRVDETRQFLENITSKTNNQDGLAVGERIYTMEDLFEYDLIDPDIDMDKLGDLEAKEKNMVMSTGVPDSYILPSEGAGDLGGNNANSLQYLSKIFQRRCDSVRSAFLEGLTSTFRMNLMLKGIGDGDKSEFELSMPTPANEFDEDKISKDSDLMSLAVDMISNLGQSVGIERGDTLNPLVVKDILKTYLPIPSNKLNKWIDLLIQTHEEEQEEEQENNSNGIPSGEGGENSPLIVPTGNVIGGNKPTKEKIQEKQKFIKKYPLLEKAIKGENNLLNECYLQAKANRGIMDGRLGNRQYYNNSYALNRRDYKYSPISLLKEETKIRQIKRIKEEKST